MSSQTSFLDLPVEVWRAIVQPLKSTPKAVQTISLVCKSLRQVCLPFVFERIVFDGFSGLGRAFELFAFLDRNPRTRDWVRELRIANWSIVGPGMPAGGLNSTAMVMERAFGMLNNVRVLEISRTYVTKGMWAHIGRLSQLQSFSFQPTYVMPDVEDGCFAESRVREIRLWNGENGASARDQAWRLLRLPSLTTVRIDVWLLTAAGRYLQSTTSEGPTANVQLLDIFAEGTSMRLQEGNFTALQTLLRTYPQTTQFRTPDTMEVRSGRHIDNGEEGEGEGLAPNVTEFQGMPHNVPLFCEHMPLESLVLSGAAAFPLKESYLVGALFQLRELSLHGVAWDAGVMRLIEQHCGQLEELKVYAYTMSLQTENTVPDLPNLRHVVLLCRHTPDASWFEVKATSEADWKENERRAVREVWYPKLPHLTQVRFNNLFCWKLFGSGWEWIEERDRDVTLLRGESKHRRP